MRKISDRIRSTQGNNCVVGDVRWSPAKSLWFSGMFMGWIVGGSMFFSWSAVLIFFTSSSLILCGGHSLGMHRKLIHDSFECPKWLERLGVYLGTLVGLGGPLTMMRTHDMRDWAQQQTHCHDFFSHKSKPLKDFWWQIHCELNLQAPPEFLVPSKLRDDKFIITLQRTAMLQQIPIALLLLAIGGWGYVFWGVFGRVSVSIFGHWLIGYIAHNHGHQDWTLRNAAAQGYNVRFCGLITFGECWHNNHHAFPESARLGLKSSEPDPGWWVLMALKRIGLVWNLKQPGDLKVRPSLTKVHHS